LQSYVLLHLDLHISFEFFFSFDRLPRDNGIFFSFFGIGGKSFLLLLLLLLLLLSMLLFTGIPCFNFLIFLL